MVGWVAKNDEDFGSGTKPLIGWEWIPRWMVRKVAAVGEGMDGTSALGFRVLTIFRLGRIYI